MYMYGEVNLYIHIHVHGDIKLMCYMFVHACVDLKTPQAHTR